MWLSQATLRQIGRREGERGGGVMEGSLGSQGVSEQGAEISNEVI